jgi:uncharacterized protein (TIGR02466 family)
MPVQGWFSTPIYFNKVKEPVLSVIQKEFDSVVSEFEKNNTFQYSPGWLPGTHKLSNITFQNNFFEDYKLDTFMKELSIHLNAYVQEVGMHVSKSTSFKVTSSWITKFAKNEFAHSHDHGSSDISGAYYYQVPNYEESSESGRIQFHSPVEQLNTSYVYENIPQQVTYPAEVGVIILFPSWLRHGVSVNESNQDRMSVSFNIIFDRNF